MICQVTGQKRKTIRVRISSIELTLDDEIIDFIADSIIMLPLTHSLIRGANLAGSHAQTLQTVSICQQGTENSGNICRMHASELMSFPFSRRNGKNISVNLYIFENLPLSYFMHSQFRKGQYSGRFCRQSAPYQRNKRTRKLISLSEEKTSGHLQYPPPRNVRRVLYERQKTALCQGFTDNYIRVEMPYDATMINRETPSAW